MHTVLPEPFLYVATVGDNIIKLRTSGVIMPAMYGLLACWLILVQVFKFKGWEELSNLATSLVTALFAVGCLLAAWYQEDGWAGPSFISEAWNQIIPRVALTVFGVLSGVVAVHRFPKSSKR